MEQVRIDLTNCYGIKGLTATFDFWPPCAVESFLRWIAHAVCCSAWTALTSVLRRSLA
jgi:hypothetical protein